MLRAWSVLRPLQVTEPIEAVTGQLPCLGICNTDGTCEGSRRTSRVCARRLIGCAAGGLAGKESDVAADEAIALSNIHSLLDTLDSQQHSTAASLSAKEV